MAYTLAVAARRHLGSAVSEPLVIFESLLNSVGRLALAFKIVWVVFLQAIRFRI